MSTSSRRVLPLRVPLAPEEGIDSWLEALARRNGVSLRKLLSHLDLPEKSLTRTLLTSITPPMLRELERRCQLPTHHLDQAVPHPALPTHTRQARGSRYCPHCLAERDGRFKLSWWLPSAFACTSHRTLLLDTCPGCGRLPHRTLPGRTRFHPAGVCTAYHRDGHPCGTDLRTAPTIQLPCDSTLLDAQRWTDQLLAENAVDSIADLHHLSRWLLHALPDEEVRPLGALAAAAWADRPSKAPPDRLAPLNPILTAIAAHHSRPLLGPCDDTAVRRIRQLRTTQGSLAGLYPASMALLSWRGLSPRLRGRFIHAADSGLTHLDRIRLCSSSPAARVPAPDETPHASRRQHVPQLLWPGWTLRFLPPIGLRVDLFRATAAALLFLPGSGSRDKKALLEPLHTHAPNYIAHTLQTISQSGYDQVFPAICRLADHLDEHGSEIDYQRRRELVPADTISETAWRELCFRTNTHPGETSTPTAPGRLLHARRHLFQLLTGADLADPRHTLAWKDPGDRNRTTAFDLSLSLEQRTALHHHAQELLVKLGIDEPVTWQPPEECCYGLNLPGPRLNDIDLDALRRLMITERRTPSETARQLETSVTHVRLALERIGQEPRHGNTRSPTSARKVREHARSVLTPAYFQREYTEGGKTLTRIAEDTGISRHVVAEQAKAIGLPLYFSRRPLPIDEAWLREQYLDRKRSTGNIASEIGTEDETVRRRLQHLGISLRPPGVHSRTVMTAKLDTTIPRNIRTAVEGTLHGWLRLHRFHIAMAFPNLESAAAHIGIYQSTLVTQFQCLEHDLGQKLFHRSAFGRPHRPTNSGKALLRSLHTDTVQALMHTELQPSQIIAMPDADTLAQAASRLTTRRDPGPLKPFNDISVARIRITAPTLTLLRDLLDHQDEEFYGAQIHARTGLDHGTVYPQLKRLEQAGWLTSRPESQGSWHGRAPVGCGPGRRRTYFALTPEGLRAATLEVHHPTPRRKKRTR
ncbi:TniQ family protein [Streptomyces sp. NPDC059452]|uniref:TniQ family protein n=1 Tax=Streptomyces sp. NPDC059452 TaxID=3346835 RepID=UPI0036AAA056